MLETSPMRPEHAADEGDTSTFVRPVNRPPHAPCGVQVLGEVDLTQREAHMARHPNRPVSEIMSTQVVSFSADTSIAQATEVMLAKAISGAPVCDDARRPIGIVSKTDLLEAWHEHQKSGDSQITTVVGDIMVPYLLAAQNSSPIALAAALMAYEGVHRLLVLDDQSNMVGIVTSLDILRWLGNLSGFLLTKPGPL
jgi:CBS domain-containing protein